MVGRDLRLKGKSSVRAYCERLCTLFTTNISDAMDRLNIRGNVMSPDIKPVISGMKVCGEAFTVRATRAIKGETLEEYVYFLKHLEKLPTGAVLVIDGKECYDVALWGELSTNWAISKGLGGVVIDGRVRDIPRMASLKFPVFARGSVPTDAVGRVGFTDINKPILCGNVIVKPGDIIFGDMDGVVVIPKSDIKKIVDLAEEIRSLEDKVRERLRSGDSLLTLVREFGVL